MGKIELILETDKMNIYSPLHDGNKYSEFEIFMEKFEDCTIPLIKADFDAIISLINKMTNDCGARENLFRPEKGNVKAIPLCIRQYKKKEIGTIRLYCIRISDKILIIGNGKIKKVAKYQEDKELAEFVEDLQAIERKIYLESKKKGISYNDFSNIKEIIEQISI